MASRRDSARGKGRNSGRPDSDGHIVTQVREFFYEADDAKRDRMDQNRVNFEAYNERQDWSNKIEGQSCEFIPKTHLAVETFTAFIKKGLIATKDWYLPSFGEDAQFPLAPEVARRFLDNYLSKILISEGETTTAQQVITDGLKMGAIGSLVIVKVHGQLMSYRRYKLKDRAAFSGQGAPAPSGEELDNPISEDADEENEPIEEDETNTLFESGQLVHTTTTPFYLRWDLIRQEDYYPDPTGRNLYKIHRSQRDYYEILARAKEGIYDLAVVEELGSWIARDEKTRAAREKNQNYADSPARRREITIDEFWGTLLNEDGSVFMENCVCTVANEQFLIRRPIPNPYWHQQCPIVAFPIIRVPMSVWHRALVDGPAKLNLALNELFNLMLDGGLSAVWGVREVRMDALEHPEQISGGIPQGAVIPIKNNLPAGAQAINVIGQGEIPQPSMLMYEALDRAFNESAMTSELRLGSFPAKAVRAAEVVELAQSQATLVDSMISDIELGIEKLLKLSWMLLMQFAPRLDQQTVVNAIGIADAFRFARLTDAQRYAMFASPCAFKVDSLSTLSQRIKDFQKFMAALQAINQSPMLLMEFFRRYSPSRAVSHILKSLLIDPTQMLRDDKEMQTLEADIQMFQQFTQMLGPSQGQAMSGPGGDPLTSDVNRRVNPLTTMGSGA